MKLIAQNRRANFEYFLLDKFEAGICLKGSEVKSLRKGLVNLSDSFVTIKGTDVYIKNMYIKPYEMATGFIEDAKQDRKLLLHKNEILKLKRESLSDGLTIVPTKIYFKNELVKLEIAIAKGKKLYDKRETIKQKELLREKGRHILV